MENLTKRKILDAAKALFIEQGFAGTSVGKIAKLAQVNHSLIFHHFTNKENLWIEVKLSILEQANSQMPIIPSLELSFRDFLRELIKNCIHFYQSHPDLIRLLNWQRLESKDHPGIGLTHSHQMQLLIEAIQHYQQKGEIHQSYKPVFIMSFFLSVTSSTALDPNILIQREIDYREYIDFCVDFFENALKSARS